MANFFIGDEIKFAIKLQAEGFSMDEADFDVKIVHPRGSIEGTKEQGGSEDGKLIIFRDPETDSSSSDSSEEPTAAAWYCIVDTTGFAEGKLKVVAIAHIPDANASGGIRTETATSVYGSGQNP